jgi:hypothetical protein
VGSKGSGVGRKGSGVGRVGLDNALTWLWAQTKPQPWLTYLNGG